MNKLEQIQAVQDEVKDPSKPKVINENKSWVRKWLDRAYVIVKLWTGFAVLTMIAQVVLFYFNKQSIIPGSGAIYTSAGIIAAAWVGGDQIVDRIQSKKE